MEIHIQLAGVHLGPYEEKKVRDYLSEGLLSLNDPARLEGEDTWDTVEAVLARSTGPGTSPAPSRPVEPAIPQKSPVPSGEAIAATTTLLPRTAAQSKDTIRIPMPQLAKAFGKKPAATGASGTTGSASPTKSELARTSLLTAVKNLENRTASGGLQPPPNPTETKSSPFSSVPIPLPKSAESSRTLPMSLVRAISKKSDDKEKPEAKLSPPPATASPPAAASKPLTASKALDPKRTSLLSAIKVPFAKATPTEAPAEPTSPATQNPRPPTSTIVPGKTPQTASTTPISAVRAIPKKDPSTSSLSGPPKTTTPPSTASLPAPPKPTETSATAKEAPSAPLPALRFIPGQKASEADKPTAKIKAPPSITKSLKRTTGPLPALVKAIEKGPAQSPPKTSAPPVEPKPEPASADTKSKSLPSAVKPEPDKEASEISDDTTTPSRPRLSLVQFLAKRFGLVRPAAPPSTAAQLPPPESIQKSPSKKKNDFRIPDPAPEAAPESSKTAVVSPPRRRKKIPVRYVAGAVVLIGLILFLYFYIASSYQTAAALRLALKNGNEPELEKVVDFASVRQSLKDQVETQVAKSGTPSSASTDPAVIVAMMKNSINYYLTPAELASLVTNPTQSPKAGSTPMLTPATAANLLLGLNNLPVKTQGFSSPNHFVIDLAAARLDLTFSGSRWKLSQVELNPGFQFPSQPGSNAPTPDLGSSISAPVIETYLSEGKTNYQNGDWDAAILDFSQAISLDPKQAIAYNNRGIARKAKNDLDGAIADYTQAIAVSPKLAEAYYNRGDAKAAKGDLDAAITDYTQAIVLDPKQEGAIYSRGIARTQKGDNDDAITDFTEVIALDPNQANAYNNRGVVRQAKNDLDGAIDDFTHALAINPKIAGAYYNRGLSKQAKADLDGAIADYNQAITIDPKMTRAYYSRGIAKNTKNDLDGAIADYNQTLSLDPKMALAYSDRALAKQAKGDLKGALADFNQALTYDPKIAIAYYSRGLIKEQINDYDGAIADSSRALDLDPRNYQAYYNRGFAKLTKGNLDGARTDLQKFCDLAPKDRYADNAHLYLWLIGMAQNNATGANQDLSNTLKSNWNATPDDLATKIANFLLDRITEADLVTAAASPNAEKDQGQHCEVWYFAGMKKLLAGDKATAIDYFRRCLATGQRDYCEYILAQAELQVLAPNSSP